MAAITFEQWWESMDREPLTYGYEYAKEGWNAAIKNMEAVATSYNKQSTPCSHEQKRSAIVCPICNEIDYFTD